MIKLIEVTSSKDYQLAICLFKEYAAQLNVNLTFQNFDKEIATVEQCYTRPKGLIFIAYGQDSSPLGCFGIREFTQSICELKRMYLRTEARGLGIGKLMLKKSIVVGKELGYQKMRLDTLPHMQSAIHLYRKIGFYEIDPYRFNPVKGTKYFEISLNP